MSSIEIYYFTGTGNTLHIARELQKRIPEAKLIPLASLLDKKPIETFGETVGFVFPIYMAAIPMPVRNFIKKLDTQSAKYIFAIATRIGTTHTAFKSIDKILAGKGQQLDAYFSLNMPSNDPKFNYKVPTDEEIAALETVVQDKLDSIHRIIVNKESCREKDTNYTSSVPFLGLLSGLTVLTEGMKVNMYSDEKCIGCGTCAKVCPARRIKMVDGKPLWQDKVKCFKCSACLNFCPKQAAQIKSFTEKNGRYSHPYATVNDIAGQKEEIV